MTGPLVHWLDVKFYPHSLDNWDDHELKKRVLKTTDSKDFVLDLGAGVGLLPFMDFRPAADVVIGLDVNREITSNRLVDYPVLGDALLLPFSDASFDAVIANNLLEHLREPAPVFAEVARVLKPGGRFLFKTPNKRHYVPLTARLVPDSFHAALVSSRGRSRKDVFPTRYQANTSEAVRELAKGAELETVSIDLIEGRPEYCRVFWLLYIFGIMFERAVNSFASLAKYRVVILGELRKPSESS